LSKEKKLYFLKKKKMNEYFEAMDNFVPALSVPTDQEENENLFHEIIRKATEYLKNGYKEGVYQLKKPLNLQEYQDLQKLLEQVHIFLEEQVLFDSNYYLTFFINLVEDNWTRV
jgi:hypothetical protein